VSSRCLFLHTFIPFDDARQPKGVPGAKSWTLMADVIPQI
jgi:hypothetical protein